MGKLRLGWPTAMYLAMVLIADVRASEERLLEPLFADNGSPFIGVFVTPRFISVPAQRGTLQWSVGLDTASHSIIQRTASEELALDGETWRAHLSMSYRLSERWVVQATLPWLSHSGGILDAAIDQWHALTGLADGQRDRQPRNKLEFAYRNAVAGLRFDHADRGLGDLTASAAYRLSGSVHQQTWLQLDVKLPSGTTGSLSGSGEPDVALSVEHRRKLTVAGRHSEIALLFSAIDTGVFAPLPIPQETLQTQLAVHWGVALGQGQAGRLSHKVVPELQLRWRSAPYKSSIPHLGSASVGIETGVQWLTRHGIFKAGISEDLLVDSAPDVGFYLRFIRRPQLAPAP